MTYSELTKRKKELDEKIAILQRERNSIESLLIEIQYRDLINSMKETRDKITTPNYPETIY